MYNAPRNFELLLLPVLILSIYMWGYFRPAYIRRSNVSIPVGSGRCSIIPLFECIKLRVHVSEHYEKLLGNHAVGVDFINFSQVWDTTTGWHAMYEFQYECKN